jgi:sugar lactone lactonase YvrE
MPRMRRLMRVLVGLVVAAILLLLAVRIFFGGGARLEDRTTDPTIPASAIEQVAALDYPPGNIAVSETGRVFLTLHPDGKPPIKVVELVDGKLVAFPDEAFQRPEAGTAHFQSPLSMRIDRQNRLWVLDFADFGRGQPRILAFDLGTRALVHQYDFPSDVAGWLSMLNDFAVSPDGTRVYIAESSPIKQTPALIVYDVEQRTSRRVLDHHPSVLPKDYILTAGGRDMIVLGIYTLRIGVDSIALDRAGGWLYYAPVNGDRMFRVPTAALDNAALTPDELAAQVEDYGPKTMSDGLSTDDADQVYITDPEHSAILTLGPDRRLETLVKDAKLRWPDGLSFGPGGWLYVTCSSLQHVLFVPSGHQAAHAPYHVFRFKPGQSAIPGH